MNRVLHRSMTGKIDFTKSIARYEGVIWDSSRSPYNYQKYNSLKNYNCYNYSTYFAHDNAFSSSRYNQGAILTNTFNINHISPINHLPQISSPLFHKCSQKKCKTCPMADQSQISIITGLHFFCKYFQIIYKITCGICKSSDIGQTINALNLRINKHRHDILKHNTFSATNKINFQAEFEHFQLHNFNNATISILKRCKNATDLNYFENLNMNIHKSLPLWA